jgi:glutathionylspermidine synthase
VATAQFCAEVRPIRCADPLSEPSLQRDLVQRYLVWDAHVAGRRRVDVHPLVISEQMHRQAMEAAERVVWLVGQAAKRAHHDPRERALYALHPTVEALAAASHASGDTAMLARVDLLLGEDGQWRACEINSDCPGGHNEALGLPRLARSAGFREGANPTRSVEALVDRLEALSHGRAVSLIYASAFAEDLQVCALVQRLLEERGQRALLAPATAPRWSGRSLTVRGEEVGVLYRYFPAEYMQDQDNVGDIVHAVRSGAVRSMTSFGHIFLQSKLAFARAWARRGELDAASRDALRAHLPPTFGALEVSRSTLLEEQADWVLKRAYGRVGDEVFVGPLFDSPTWQALVDEVRGLAERGDCWIAQRFVKQSRVPTPWGERFVTLGAYVMDGRFVGYFARITPESHVSHDALCVPVFVERAS